ncbi:MAG TPA: guanylate kinase [Candidatus Cloacimonetes bacterium]|nr:guanylate kinase [Candidatus Cloacimonadota bacterium]HEX37959.1 guanylate kinase [Candidatus Cloacimonadota bacterium]
MTLKKYFPIIVSSPSGAGKNSVCDMVVEKCANVVYSISYTTRPIRTTEEDGVDYHFVSEEKFKKMIDEDRFLEWAQYLGYYYGTSKKMVEEVIADEKYIILAIETKGALKFMKRRPDALSIFIFPPSMKELEKRLRNRNTDSSEIIETRLENARHEIADCVYYDRFVINDNLDRVSKEIINLIEKKSKGLDIYG